MGLSVVVTDMLVMAVGNGPRVVIAEFVYLPL